jgi:hypothetical protein
VIFIVYHGHKTPDNCDASEGPGPYRLDCCKSEESGIEILAAGRKE